MEVEVDAYKSCDFDAVGCDKQCFDCIPFYWV